MKYKNSLLTAERNIEIIEAGEITAEKYPVLHSLLYDKRSSRREHLLDLYGFMMYHEPVTIFGRLYWWELSQSQRKKEGFTGGIATWQSQLMFFYLCGILERVKPNKKTADRYMREKYLYYREQKQQPPIFYAPLLLTAQRLKNAEMIAADFLSRGFSPSRVTKKLVIRYRGQRIANGIYQDGRGIKDWEKAAEKRVVSSLKKQIAQNGYARKDSVPTMKTIINDVGERVEVPDHSIRKALLDFKRICIDNALSYHRATAAEIKKFGLRQGQWIATPAEKGQEYV